MKNLTKKTTAIFAAAVMSFSAMAVTAVAKGWSETENGKKYVLSDGKEASSGKYNIGGTVYEFSGEGYCLGEFSGWAKSGGVKRRYNNGKPYTGWLKDKDGGKKYCLDGYLVTDEIQIGKYSYSFNEQGLMSGKTPLAISADCGKVTAGTKIITITLTMLTDGVQSFGAPVLLERWEKGQWVDCFADLDGNIPMTLQMYSMAKDDSLDIEFNSLVHTGYKLTPGFYRIPINNVAAGGVSFGNPIALLSEDGTVTPVSGRADNSETSADHVSTYALFEVVAK